MSNPPDRANNPKRMFEGVPDETVQGIFDRTSKGLAHYSSLSPEVQTAANPKGSTKQQSAIVQAHLWLNAAKELEHRGHLPKGWTESND